MASHSWYEELEEMRLRTILQVGEEDGLGTTLVCEKAYNEEITCII